MARGTGAGARAIVIGVVVAFVAGVGGFLALGASPDGGGTNGDDAGTRVDAAATDTPSADSLAGGLPAWAADFPASAATLLAAPPTAGAPTSMPWQFVSLGAGGTSLDVVYVAGGGGRVMPVGFQVEETATSVELWAGARPTVATRHARMRPRPATGW